MSASLNFYSQNVGMDRILRENLTPQAVPFQGTYINQDKLKPYKDILNDPKVSFKEKIMIYASVSAFETRPETIADRLAVRWVPAGDEELPVNNSTGNSLPDADIGFKSGPAQYAATIKTPYKVNYPYFTSMSGSSYKIADPDKIPKFNLPYGDGAADKKSGNFDFPSGDINLDSADLNIDYPEGPYSPQQWQADLTYPRGGVNIYGQNSSINMRGGIGYPIGDSNPVPTGTAALNPIGNGSFSDFIYGNRPAGSGFVNPSGYTIKNTGVGNPIANLIYKTSVNAPLSQNTGLNNGNTGNLIPQTSNGPVENTGSSAINSGTPVEQVSSDSQQSNQAPINVYVYGNINHNNDNNFYDDFRNKNYNFNGVLDKLSPEVKAIAEKYGKTMAGKSVIIDENGGLVGVYNTSDLQNLTGTKMGETDPVNYHGKGTAIGKEISLPDGNKVKIINNAYASPLAFDLNGDGIKTSNKKISYDIDGDGKKDKINDVNDGILCVNGGKDGKDLFGDNTDIDRDGKADGKDGFESLKVLALKEGLINGEDDMKLDKADIKTLEQKYDLGIKQGYKGKVRSLEDVGIDEINLARIKKTLMKNNFDKKGNKLMTQQGATFRMDGKEREYADVWHKKYD